MGLGQKPKNIGKVIIGINLQKHLCHVLLVTEMFFIKNRRLNDSGTHFVNPQLDCLWLRF